MWMFIVGGLLILGGLIGLLYHYADDDASWRMRTKAWATAGGAGLLWMLAPVVRAVPGTWRLFHWLNTWSAWQMQRAAGADALANVRLNSGREDFRPAKYVEGAEDEKHRDGWKIKGNGDKRYDPAVHGRSASRYGKADIIHVDEDSLEQGAWAECSMDNAFALDRERYLFRDAKVTIQQLVYNAEDAAGQPTRADGGQHVTTQDVSLSKPGILEDVLVPINSRAGYDGQVISWNQYQNLKAEQADQSTVRDAKNQAWAAAKLDDIERADLLKWAIILGLAGAVLLFHQDIGAFIAGLGGGGAGGAAGGALG